MEKNRSKGKVVVIVVVALILVISGIAFSGILNGFIGGASSSTTPTHSTSQSTSTATTHSGSGSTISALAQIGSGLVVSDPLTSGNYSAWTISGFSSSGNPLCTPSENSSGLCLEVQPQNSNQWAGNFAARNVGNATVYHAVLTMPYSTTSNNSAFNMGLYVKPQLTYPPNPGQAVNYVSCGVSVTSNGYVWQVVYGTGNLSGASNTQLLNYTFNRPSLTQACTIITNGVNLLKVYLGSTLFYSNSSMNLQIASPFSTYLEIGAVNSTGPMQGEFSDFYSSLNNTISVTNAPIGGTVSIVDSSNSTIATASVGSNGLAVIPVTPYQNPPNGYIRVYDSTGKLVASTSTAATLWGGDAYSVG